MTTAVDKLLAANEAVILYRNHLGTYTAAVVSRTESMGDVEIREDDQDVTDDRDSDQTIYRLAVKMGYTDDPEYDPDAPKPPTRDEQDARDNPHPEEM